MIRIVTAPALADLTTLRLGGPCLARVSFAVPDDLEALPEVLARLGGRPEPFGGGSNILAAGGEGRRVLVSPELRYPPEAGEPDARGAVPVRVDAGMRLSRLLAWCAARGLSGLEGLAGVPGTVGGAVAGNAGSFGTDAGALLCRVGVFSPRKGLLNLAACDVRRAYRHFSVPCLEAGEAASPDGGPGWYVITEAVFALRLSAPASVMAAMRANAARKIGVQPVRARSAGCVFKNPEAAPRDGSGAFPAGAVVSAGKLLDEAGFRGRRRGGMLFSPLHANFLVNDGRGTPGEALELIGEARARVRERFGVELRPEVKIWDC